MSEKNVISAPVMETAHNTRRRINRVHLVSLLVTLSLVIVTAMPVVRTAHAQEIQITADPVISYDMALQGPPEIVEDLSGHGNHGNPTGYSDLLMAYVQDPDGGTAFIRFDGAQHIWATGQVPSPTEFTIEVEFRTELPGGKLAGFEDEFRGLGTLSDRLIYIGAGGRLHFAGASGLSVVTSTNAPVTDGLWHHAVATATVANNEIRYELFLDGVFQGAINERFTSSYPGHWRIGGGNISGYPGATDNFFQGDVRLFRVYDEGNPTPEPTAITQPTATPFVDHEFEEEHFSIIPRVDVSADVGTDELTLNITFQNIDPFDTEVWVVREEDGEEFPLGPMQFEMEWVGEAETSRYAVEVRRADLSDFEETQVIAAGTVAVFAQPATRVQVATAVVVALAVTGTAAAASASGTWIFELIWRFLRIVLAEKLRRRTKKLDLDSIPSWVAIAVALVLMAFLIAIGRPGSLGLSSFFGALAVTVPAVIVYRFVTILGGWSLAYYSKQEPKYLVWAAGTISFAITSIALQSPIGYTGYMERKPGEPARDARFAAAGFAAILALSGLFVMIGVLTRMSFAETGVTLTLGVLAVTMLPLPLMGGHNIWKWNQAAGVASGVVGMIPYILFQLGYFSPTGTVVLATFGLMAFGALMVGELWMLERKALQGTNPPVEPEEVDETLAVSESVE